MTATRLLAVEDLSVGLSGPAGEARLLRGISFALDRGGTLALVGESGSGKTMTARALLGLLPPGARARGRVLWEGTDLLALPEDERRAWRGRRMTMVSQEPSASLNPVLTAGEQVAELLRHHHGLGRRAAAERAVALLEEVRLPDARARAADHPHRLSGGMRQRVEIAAALACAPDLLIADEPTTALDVTVQAQILALLAELVRGRRMALLYITHDLALVPGVAGRIAVLYAGCLVESGPAAAVLAAPAHPYTRELVRTLPESWPPGSRLPELEGSPPDPLAPPPGCPFAPRCPRVRPECAAAMPPPVTVGAERAAACLPAIARELAQRPVSADAGGWP